MHFSSEHIKWLKHTGDTIVTQCGKRVPVLSFEHDITDEQCLSSWAKHFRNHYCNDDEIDELRSGSGLSRKNYLKSIKFPVQKILGPEDNTGPATRSGDFCEILVSDYIEFVLNFWVPRTRYEFKVNRNTSEQGSDVMGFKFAGGEFNPNDELLIFEVKGSLTGNKGIPRLQDAVDHSDKDKARLGMSLNAVKQRLLIKGRVEESLKVKRFQNLVDRPYIESYGAAAVLVDDVYDSELLSKTDSSDHRSQSSLSMIVIRGEKLMDLVHLLYESAANEA